MEINAKELAEIFARLATAEARIESLGTLEIKHQMLFDTVQREKQLNHDRNNNYLKTHNEHDGRIKLVNEELAELQAFKSKCFDSFKENGIAVGKLQGRVREIGGTVFEHGLRIQSRIDVADKQTMQIAELEKENRARKIEVQMGETVTSSWYTELRDKINNLPVSDISSPPHGKYQKLVEACAKHIDDPGTAFVHKGLKAALEELKG